MKTALLSLLCLLFFGVAGAASGPVEEWGADPQTDRCVITIPLGMSDTPDPMGLCRLTVVDDPDPISIVDDPDPVPPAAEADITMTVYESPDRDGRTVLIEGPLALSAWDGAWCTDADCERVVTCPHGSTMVAGTGHASHWTQAGYDVCAVICQGGDGNQQAAVKLVGPADCQGDDDEDGGEAL